MDEITYDRNVRARCSQEWHGKLVERGYLAYTLRGAIQFLTELDNIKKALFYGKPLHGAAHEPVEPLQSSPEYKTRNLVHAIIGAATEAGELLEALLAKIENGTEFDEVNLQEEFGDLNWYRVLGLNMLSQSHEQNIAQNDRKLEKRYGPVFSSDAANNRDLDSERKTLEG